MHYNEDFPSNIVPLMPLEEKKMKRQEAEEIIGKENIMSDWSLRMNRINHYLFWNVDSDNLYLEGYFSVNEIEAILWWTKHIT